MQTKQDILEERYNAYLNGKAARLEGWTIGMNVFDCLPETKDLWMLWRLGWSVVDDNIKEKVNSLLHFRGKKFKFN